MLQTLKPNNNIYNGTVFELNNNNDFVQKIYLNDISIDTFIKNIDETNNYIAFIRRVSIKQYEKNPYWFNNGPNIEYHLCILRIPPGFYDTVESCIDVINRTYIENTSNLFKEDSSDLYYARKQDYLLKIIDDALVFNPTIYAFPIFFDKMVYTDKTSFDIKLKDIYQPSEVMQNILALTNTVQNFGITNIYNYLLNYYNNINDMSGLIDFSLSDRSVKYYKLLTKEAVSQANLWLRKLCEEMQIPFADSHSLLIDPNTGYLKPEYQNDEYMHLTSEAYAVILENLRLRAKELGY